jgi:hypothetical protein
MILTGILWKVKNEREDQRPLQLLGQVKATLRGLCSGVDVQRQRIFARGNYQ